MVTGYHINAPESTKILLFKDAIVNLVLNLVREEREPIIGGTLSIFSSIGSFIFGDLPYQRCLLHNNFQYFEPHTPLSFPFSLSMSLCLNHTEKLTWAGLTQL